MVSVLATIACVLGVVLLFSLAVFIHEFGHFLAARWLGFRVDAFSIGFGPALWKKKIGGTVYKISLIPFGGYVALPQLDPAGMEKIQGAQEKGGEGAPAEVIPEAAAWKRIVVAFAGPFGNVVLAVVLALAIWLAPNAHTGAVDTRVGAVFEEAPAYAAGLRAGDRIVSVNGTEVETWNDFRTETMIAGEGMAQLVVVRADGAKATLSVALDTNNVFGVAMLPGVLPYSACKVARVLPESAAAAAGIQSEDEILSCGGVAVESPYHFSRLMTASRDREVEIVYSRGGVQRAVKVVPTFDEKLSRAVMGVMLAGKMDDVRSWMMYRNPLRQLKWDAMSVVRVLQALVVPKGGASERKAVAKQIGGPLTIIMGLYHSIQGSMWDAWGFLRMICINLALLNLLPIPVLDGGHIVFALYEIVARRKPNRTFITWLTNAFAWMLIALMLFLVYRDVILQSRLATAMAESAESGERKAESGE